MDGAAKVCNVSGMGAVGRGEGRAHIGYNPRAARRI